LLPLSKPRDARLDFWRGLCLIDMVVVHLLVQGLEIGHFAHAVVGDYLRFAAGGFIFVAGLSVGRIFLPKAQDDAKRAATYWTLLRRAFYILCVHYTATLGFMVFSPLRGEVLPPIHLLVRDILLLREGYDLLPFYVVMMALAPLMLEAIRRRAGWVLAIGSVALFVWGQNHHEIASVPIQQTFYVVLWQLIFVAGLLFGAAFKRYDALAVRSKAWLAGGATVATIIFSTLAYGWHFGLPKVEFLWFVKVPLSGGEMLRYIAFIAMVIMVTDLLWTRIAGSGVDRFVSRLGRKSLAMYVSHVFVVGVVVMVSYKLRFPPAFQWLYILLAVVAVWSIAWGMETFAARARQPKVATGRLAMPRLGNSGIAMTAISLLVVLGVFSRFAPTVDQADEAIEEFIDWAWDADPEMVVAIATPARVRFASPVTPGILSLDEDGIDSEVFGNARVARPGRTQTNGIAGSPFRRQL